MAVSFEQLNTGDFATDQDVDAVKKQIESLSSSVGTLSSLATAQKNNLVAAINELVDRLDIQDTHITDFDQRLENEENQVDFITGTIIGDRDNLGTTDKSSIVGAINEVNGNLNNIKYEPIEDDHYYTKKYDNGYFESAFEVQLSPELGNPLTFQPLASGQTLFYRARIANMAIGIKATRIFSLELTAQNTGIIWPVSPSMNANMASVDTYVIQQGNDNTRTTTIRGRVTGKWK